MEEEGDPMLTEGEGEGEGVCTPAKSANAADDATGVPGTAVAVTAGLNIKKAHSFQKRHQLFLDETVPSFFRRLTFSPDGSFLLAPTGQFKSLASASALALPGGENNKENNASPASLVSAAPAGSAGDAVAGASPDGKCSPCVYVFHRSNLKRPVAFLPCKEAPIAVRFSPVIYALNKPTAKKEGSAAGGEKNLAPALTALPYRMVFAVASLKAVVLYDTELLHPFALIKNIHCASLTDIAWSTDGLQLALSSSDGYCSFVRFDQGELGAELLVCLTDKQNNPYILTYMH